MYVNGSSVGLNWRVGVDFVVCANIDRSVKNVSSWDSVIQNIYKYPLYTYIYMFSNTLCIFKLTERELTNIRHLRRSCTNFANIRIAMLNLIIIKYSTAIWVCNPISMNIIQNDLYIVEEKRVSINNPLFHEETQERIILRPYSRDYD